MTAQIVTLIVTAALFALMGMGSLIAPTNVTAQFGIPELNRDGRNEVRAVYGGFGLAVAGALVLAVLHPEWRAGVALTVALAVGGMAGGRLLSAAVDRGISRTPLFYLGLELVGLAALLWVALG